MQTKNKNGKIGIGITTHNRREVFLETLTQIQKYAPAGAKIVVVDDASEVAVASSIKMSDYPNLYSVFRFPKNVGIATGKNKCMEKLADCEHIFLFDDDCYPKRKGWEKPYIASPEPHLMYLFKDLAHSRLRDARVVYEDDEHFAITNARGCMVYIHRPLLDIVGGYDTRYARWGYEHGDFSNRVYNLGLTSFRFGDVTGSKKLFYSGDEQQKVRTTVKYEERRSYIAKHEARYKKSFSSTEYRPYKAGAKRVMPKKQKGTRTVVICAFLNGKVDTQRNRVWQADYRELDTLRKSVTKHGHELVILHNCFDEKDSKLVKHVRVTQGASPYYQRWLNAWQYLRANPDIDRVFMVDATDVEMLHDPFPRMEKGVMYLGSEVEVLGCPWMLMTTKNETLREFVLENKRKTLLNCGVVGGSREAAMTLTRGMYEGLLDTHSTELTDMAEFNWLAYTGRIGKWEEGRHVTTLFKKYQSDPAQFPAMFRHK